MPSICVVFHHHNLPSVFNQSPIFEHLGRSQLSVTLNNNSVVNILMTRFCFELFFRIFLEECWLGERMYIFIDFDTCCQVPQRKL